MPCSEPREWPFDQPPHATAISDRQVVEEGQSILVVVHYEDDHSWAFLSGTDNGIVDGRVIAMATILRFDPGLLELAGMPPGFRAQRSHAGGPWHRAPNHEG
jgi:hypothetical protein